MGVERLRPAGLYAGAPYAYASLVPAGRTVFTAGACPLNEEGQTVAPGDFEGQARQAVANLFEALAAAGAGPADVVKSTIFVVTADRADLVNVWSVVKEAFGEEDVPSTLLGVSCLGYQDQLVEIEAVASLP